MPVTLDEIQTSVKGIDKRFSDELTPLTQRLAAMESDQKTVGEAVESFRQALKANRNEVYKAGSYRGFFPNEEMAKNFGMICLAAAGKGFAKDHVEKHGLLVKAMGEGSDAAGGNLVAPEYATSIIANVEQYGVLNRNAYVVPVGSSTQPWPKLTDGFQVYSPDEGTPLTASDLAFGKVTLKPFVWAVLCVFSESLEMDAIISLGDLIGREMTRALAKKTDNNGFNGDGTPAYFGVTGLISSLGAAGKVESVNTTVTIDYIDLCNLVGALPEQFDNNAGWYMHRTVWAKCVGIKDSNGDPIAQQLFLEGRLRRMLLGYPVDVSQVMKKASAVTAGDVFMLFGDLRASVMIGQRKALQIERNDQVKWLDLMVAIRGIIRQDIKIVEPGDATDAGGYVGLKLKST